MAHMCLMIQLTRDLGGSVWLQYYHEFRVWASAKRVKVWEELNLFIYGQYLAANQRPPFISNAMPNPTQQKCLHDKKVKATAVTSGILTNHAINLLQSPGTCMCATSVVKAIEQGSAYL